MAFIPIGDLARQFAAMHHLTTTRQRLDTLTNELASGRVADPAARLAGRTDLLADTDRNLALMAAGVDTANALARRFEAAQLALDQVDAQRGIVSKELLSLPVAVTRQLVTDTAARAGISFGIAVSALNARHGSESLFSGAATDGPALADADTILAALRVQTAGATDAADLIARIDAFFDDPGGGFETVAYIGDTGPAPTRRIDGQDYAVTPRGDDPALRGVMKGLALAAVAADHPAGASDAERAAIMQQAGAMLVGAGDGLAGLRATLGGLEQRAETAATRQSAALTAARIARNALIGADPEATAIALRETQTQLETQYAVTARLAGLSLAGYLR
ncbi:MAG: hypothetical protein H3C51_11655 [Rubellimicrobium sp.]|nr:hypothetical protein [Rubellimicrobium sp.]